MITNIRSWLRKPPEAPLVRCQCTDGQTRTLKIDGKAQRRFWDAEQAILEMGAIKLEALDHKGNTLRMCELAVPEAAPADEKREPKSSHESMLSHFADLLAAAYKNGATAAQDQANLAFSKFADLYNNVLKRMEALENQRIREMNATARALRNSNGQTEDDKSEFSQLVEAFFQYKAAGEQAAGAVNGTANGTAASADEED
jgi:hypothetical protein